MPKHTFELIERVLGLRLPFVAASGRPYENLRRLFAPIADDIAYVAENGTVAYLRGERIFQAVMDRDLGTRIAAAVLEREGCELMVAGKDRSYIIPKDPGFVHYLNDELDYRIQEVASVDEIAEPLSKLSVYQRAGEVDEGHWRRLFASSCEVVTSGGGWLDFMPTGVNKAHGLKQVLLRLDVDPADVLAFGDSFNDREMLALAGCGVAMAHGDPRLAAYAQRTADSVVDELEALLERR